MTQYLTTAWSNTTAKASLRDAKNRPFDDVNDEDTGIITELARNAFDAHETQQPCWQACGVYYAGGHDKQGWREANMVAMEYNTDTADRAEFTFRREGWDFKSIPTLAKCDGQECQTYLIPLHRPVSWKEYIEVTTRIAATVNVPGLSLGYFLPTFLFRVRLDDAANDRQGHNQPLDVDALIFEHQGMFIAGDTFLRAGL